MIRVLWIGMLLWISTAEARLVRDVDSTIIEEMQSNPSMSYMIQFHAPWCGHCKHLEPIYEDFAKDAQNIDNLQVVRLDATVYTDVADRYDIRGFPTIKFIHQSKVITYEGQRTKDALLKFVQRAHGPSTLPIKSKDMLEQLRRDTSVFVVFIVESEDSTFSEQYHSIINRYYTQIEFYTTDDRTLFPHDDKYDVFVVKGQHTFPYEPFDYDDNFETFLQAENVASFPQISHTNIRDLIQTKKILVIYAYDFQHQSEKTEQSLTRIQWKERIQQYVDDNVMKFYKKYQFGWSTDLDLFNRIALWTVDEPLFFLYDTQKHSYGMTNIDRNIDDLLEHSSDIILHTGDSWSKRLIRPFWELYRTFISMFIEAPLATMLVTGLPAAMLSIICYCVCCLPNEATVSADHEEYEESDDTNKTATDKKDE